MDAPKTHRNRISKYIVRCQRLLHCLQKASGKYSKQLVLHALELKVITLFIQRRGITRPVVIPNWKEVPVFVIKNNLRTAGITREEYFYLLKKL